MTAEEKAKAFVETTLAPLAVALVAAKITQYEEHRGRRVDDPALLYHLGAQALKDVDFIIREAPDAPPHPGFL